MENVWAIVCSKAIVDKRTNMVTLVEATDALEFEGELPSLDGKTPINIEPVAIQIATFWYRTDSDKPETGKGRHVLIGPNEQELGHHEIEVDLQGSISRYGIALVSSLPFVGTGLYHFHIEKMNHGESKWTRTASLPLLLRTK